MQQAQWLHVIICMLSSLCSPANLLRGLSRRSTVGQSGWREEAVSPAAGADSLQLLVMRSDMPAGPVCKATWDRYRPDQELPHLIAADSPHSMRCFSEDA